MKHTPSHRLLLAGLLLAFAVACASVASGQGALAPPPGAPAPTMKTLDQIEARMIVNATNTPGDATNTYIISAPGSYYLTGNITGAAGKHGISILAHNVTLDLNGFALVGEGGAANTGVDVTATSTNFCVRNGTIRNWATGVQARAAGSFVEKLRLSGNGLGLGVSNGAIVRDCLATGNSTGFSLNDRSQIVNCIATENSSFGFDCTSYVNIVDCTSSRNGGHGMVVLARSSISRCTVSRNGPVANGITAGIGCTIADCTVASNTAQGIQVGGGSTIRNCTVQANTLNGIYCTEPNCYVVGNTCDLNEVGIADTGGRVEGNSCTANASYGFIGGGLLIRNSARGNSTRFAGDNSIGANFSGSGAHGPFVAMAAGGTITSTSPWANFSY